MADLVPGVVYEANAGFSSQTELTGDTRSIWVAAAGVAVARSAVAAAGLGRSTLPGALTAAASRSTGF